MARRSRENGEYEKRLFSRIERRYRARYSLVDLRLTWVYLVWLFRVWPPPVKIVYGLVCLTNLVGPSNPGIAAAAVVPIPFRKEKPLPAGLANILDSVDATPLIGRIKADRFNGRHGYEPQVLWRAYLASFLLNMHRTNALIRRLEEDATLRRVCGFGRKFPHRTTFNRFITRFGRHQDLIEDCMAVLVTEMKKALPDLWERVAIDSTTVRSHSHPTRAASVTVKPATQRRAARPRLQTRASTKRTGSGGTSSTWWPTRRMACPFSVTPLQVTGTTPLNSRKCSKGRAKSWAG